MRDVEAIPVEFDRLAAVEVLGAFSHTDVYFPWLLRQFPAASRTWRKWAVEADSSPLSSLRSLDAIVFFATRHHPFWRYSIVYQAPE